MAITTGVFPVHNNQFKIGTKGLASVIPTDMVTIKDLENFSPAFNTNIEEWTPMDTAGWIRRLLTGKDLVIGFSGKRNYGDPGQDYIQSMIMVTGQGAETVFQWVLPNGDTLTMNCVINLTTPAGGDSTGVDAFEFELQSDGLPVYYPGLRFVTVGGSGAGKTKITSVAPSLTAGNSYRYSLTGPQLALGASAAAWTAYTLAADITTTQGTILYLAECDSSNLVVRSGQAIANVT